MTNPQLEINRVLLAEAADMVAARTKCAIIHHTSDIDAAGDEVEMCVRHILRSRIGNNYCVGHGHICDVTWKTSPQFDIVIADNALFTSLFRTANGTEYFPFETVYAVGEVKSTYRKSNDQIAKFMQACDKLKTLARQDVPPSFIRSHTGGFDLGSALVTDRHGKQNHLFKFMLFVDSGDFDLDDIIPLYKAASVERLPNVVCLLDRGIVVRSSVDGLSTHEIKPATFALMTHPELPERLPGRHFAWTLCTNDDGNGLAHNWGILYAMIVEHLLSTTVRPVSPLAYFQHVASAPKYQFLQEPVSD